WKSYCRDVIAPMEKEATMMMLLFIMVGVITVFIILVVFYMIVSHKSRDIGILKSFGASRFSIVRLFLYFAFLIGLTGAAVGMAGGCVFLAKINTLEDTLFNKFGWQLWNREVYAIEQIPNQLHWQLLAIIFASAIGASLLGSLIPSWQIARRKCIEILQVNQL
ncbi:MAG: FtsX-like permease family protein, partial [Planctomycetes bacterium]|nr:FtsX-like permease family protein [Planctomycetota bacterium]